MTDETPFTDDGASGIMKGSELPEGQPMTLAEIRRRKQEIEAKYPPNDPDGAKDAAWFAEYQKKKAERG